MFAAYTEFLIKVNTVVPAPRETMCNYELFSSYLFLFPVLLWDPQWK